MARRKSPQDQEWESIFNAISFDVEPDPKYIKEATIRTVSGKRYKLNGHEFANVMEHERHLPPEEAVVASCKVTLDFEKLKTDITMFAERALRKASRRYARSNRQKSQMTKMRKAANTKNSSTKTPPTD
jgi:hypothetical protein